MGRERGTQEKKSERGREATNEIGETGGGRKRKLESEGERQRE